MKIVVMILLIVVAGVGLLCFFNNQSPVWVGQAANGDWTAVYEEGPHKKWFGTLQWNGNEEPILLYREFKINGNYVSGDKTGESRNERIVNNIEFVAFGERPNDNDCLELLLKWTEGKITFEETIVLKHKH